MRIALMELPAFSFLRRERDGSVLLDVHVIPNAPTTQVVGLHDGALRVRLKAPPVDGRANEALQAWLADQLDIPRAQLALRRGATSRRKQWQITATASRHACWQALSPPTDGS